MCICAASRAVIIDNRGVALYGRRSGKCIFPQATALFLPQEIQNFYFVCRGFEIFKS